MFAPNAATNILLFKDMMHEKERKLLTTTDPVEYVRLKGIIKSYQETIDSLEKPNTLMLQDTIRSQKDLESLNLRVASLEDKLATTLTLLKQAIDLNLELASIVKNSPIIINM